MPGQRNTAKEHGQGTRRYPDDLVSASDFGADTALPADRALGAGADAGFEGAVPRPGNSGAQPPRQPGRRTFHAAADRSARRADRALSRPAAVARAHGGNLSAT